MARVWQARALRQPVLQGIALTRRGQSTQHAQVQRGQGQPVKAARRAGLVQILKRQFIQQPLGLAQVFGGARQTLRRLRPTLA
ncbi:hypothetical protein D3C80_1289480 [compost metagenome]